jgi:hypothetical protein
MEKWKKPVSTAGTKRAGSSLGSAGKKPRVEVPRPQWVVESCARQPPGRTAGEAVMTAAAAWVEAAAWAEAAGGPGAEAAAATGDAEPEGATALTTECLQFRDICVYIPSFFFSLYTKKP